MNATSNNLFFYEQCRLCLENEGTVHILETNNLLDDIFVCTGVKVSSSDNLPQKICAKCSETVRSWKELKLLATKNDVHLRMLFGNDEDNGGDDSDYSIPGTSIETPIKAEDNISCSSSRQKLSLLLGNDEENTQGTSIETPIKAEDNISCSSSRQKLSLLLGQDEEDTQPLSDLPVIRQTISLRKDLFPPTSMSQSPTKRESHKEKRPNENETLLAVKVERENQCKRVKVEDREQDEYVCATCSKNFTSYKKFYLHQRLHNKKLYCPLDACGKKFATKGDLQKHLRTHTGEKPYLCKICDKGFAQRVTLRLHVASLHSADKKKDSEDEED